MYVNVILIYKEGEGKGTYVVVRLLHFTCHGKCWLWGDCGKLSVYIVSLRAIIKVLYKEI